MKKTRFFERMEAMGLALTYDDVRLKSGYAEVMPGEVSLETRFSRNMSLKMPIISAAMDTVSENRLATALAKLGGIGVIHRNFTPEAQASEVSRVKHHLNALIEKPKCVYADETIENILQERDKKEFGFHSFPVIDRAGKLVGVLTKNDFDFCEKLRKTAAEVMTKEVLTGKEGTSLEEAYSLMKQHKKKVLPLTKEDGTVCGLYVLSDVLRVKSGESKHYNLDNKGRLAVAAAIGTGDDGLYRAQLLHKARVDVLVIDTAHGDSKPVYETLKALKQTYPDLDVVVGNISEPESAKRLCEAGVDGIKVGQGPGCFAAKTRVLMANGFYKNIEDIKAGEKVIGGNGEPVKVTKAWCTGNRDVISIKNSRFYKPTHVTPDHRYWVSDLNHLAKGSFTSQSYAQIAKSVATKKQPGLAWKALQDIQQDIALLPKQISFDWPETFSYEWPTQSPNEDHTNWMYAKAEKHPDLSPSYELGYVFGLYLGKSGQIQSFHEPNKVHWKLSENQGHIIDKLSSFLHICFPSAPIAKISHNSEQNTGFEVTLCDKSITELLASFGPSESCSLPASMLVNDRKYLEGLYEGLIDSCESTPNDQDKTFTHTNSNLIELFNILCYQVHGSFPDNAQEGAQQFRAKLAVDHQKEHLPAHQIAKLSHIEQLHLTIPVYDIEVDSEEHSFIADNAIVHNSICTTRVIAGIGSPQVSAVYQCSAVAESFGVPICADGGLRYSGDLTIAIGAGAHTVMMGSMLAGTEEAPGRKVFYNGRQWKYYRGMGSLSAMLDSRSSRERYRQSENRTERLIPEGVEGMVPYKGVLEDVIIQYIGGLRAGMGYVGAESIEALREKADFHRVTPSGRAESHPHDVHITKDSPNYPGRQADTKDD